ncbi:Iron-containing redox enzyme [Actinoalloteichus hymeniacidonis]|uniref:Iron-containing redox enzyme n=2 Tax=Actinoalloteichus hymeniacidonis TaxID=340345 RepID=A0AAC9MZK4_9PSEU|nr:Iron-containing redox enzyme [Actinoalloteichus hymeniacidonis]
MHALPAPRGEISAQVIEALRKSPHEFAVGHTHWGTTGSAVEDEDLQLTLFVAYELHYRGFEGVSQRWEWSPSLLALRAAAEDAFEASLRALVPSMEPVSPDGLPASLFALVAADESPSVAAHLQRDGSLEELREFLIHRSLYQLKEADPHSWGIPRLSGPAKAALVEIQSDEYGGGRAERMHSELFRTTMRGVGLDDTYRGYVDVVPAVTLAVGNAISLFGLHRRLIGALAGHLAAFEMTSSLPSRRIAAGMRRLGLDDDTVRFYDEHIEADAVHEQVAAHDLCGNLVRADPTLVGDVVFGAAAALALEGLLADRLLRSWSRGESSLAPVVSPRRHQVAEALH